MVLPAVRGGQFGSGNLLSAIRAYGSTIFRAYVDKEGMLSQMSRLI
jgi:hypothetical protein